MVHPHLVWVFKNVLGEKGYFVYIPAPACENLRTGEANAVKFELDLSNTARYSWKYHPLLPALERIERGELSLFRANSFEISEWNELERVFGLERGWGYIDLHDGSVADFVVGRITIGEKKGGRWTTSMLGRIVADRQKIPPDRVTRIAHLLEEALHQARQSSPSRVIEVADFFGGVID
ncbi:MAG: hypothetical protein AAB737_03295 [Patescibacteria group bacterium]